MRGWGQLRRRKNRDGWQLDIYVGGMRIQRSYPNKTRAQEALKEFQRLKAIGGIPGADLTGAPLLYGEVIPKVIEEYRARGYTDRTLESYLRDMDAVADYWGDRAIARTTPGECIAWNGKMRRAGLSPSTIRHRDDRLSQVHRYVEREGLLPVAPCRVPRPVLVSEERHPVSEEHLAQLVAAAAGQPRVLAALLLAADAGLRRAEIASLEGRDLDVKRRWILVRAGKGRRDRPVPILTERLATALERLELGERRRFAGGKGSRVYTLLTPLWRRVLGGRPKIHALRHRFATVALGASDVPVDDVRRWLGHTGLAVTTRYVHLRPAAIPAGVERALEGRS